MPAPVAQSVNLQALTRLEQFEEKLGFRFSEIEHLKIALDIARAKELLYPFHGDNQLKSALVAELSRRHPRESSSGVYAYAETLWRNTYLMKIARRLELYHILELTPLVPEELFYEIKDSADLIESIIGAVFADAGVGGVLAVVSKLFAHELDHPKFQPARFYERESKWHASQEVKYNGNPRDARLVLSRTVSVAPRYPVYEQVDTPTGITGVVVKVKVAGVELASGYGPNQVEAEFDAAVRALDAVHAGKFDQVMLPLASMFSHAT